MSSCKSTAELVWLQRGRTCVVGERGLVRVALLFELHVSEEHDGRHGAVDRVLLILCCRKQNKPCVSVQNH